MTDVLYIRIMAPQGHAVASSEQSSQRLPACPLPMLKLGYSSEDQRAHVLTQSDPWCMLGMEFKNHSLSLQQTISPLYLSSLLRWEHKSGSRGLTDYCLITAMCRTEKHWLLCKHRAHGVWDLERLPGKGVLEWAAVIVCLCSCSSLCCSLS